jgi:hypothetical protein
MDLVVSCVWSVGNVLGATAGTTVDFLASLDHRLTTTPNSRFQNVATQGLLIPWKLVRDINLCLGWFVST